MTTPKSFPRSDVLVVSHSDGHIEVFGEKNVSVRIVRMPAANSLQSERTAEDVAELMLPRRYRDLYRADRLRAVGNTRPLRPSTLVDAQWARDFITALNAMAGTREEVTTWML